MTKRDILETGIPLVGIYLLGLHLPLQGLTLVGGIQSGRIGTLFVGPLVGLALPVVLICSRKRIAEILAPDEPSNGVNAAPIELLAIAFAIIGVTLVVKGLPTSIQVLNLNTLMGSGKASFLRYVGPILEVVLGAFLFFRSRTLAAIWRDVSK